MTIWSSLLGLALLASAPVSGQIDEAEFMNPGMEYRPVPLWFWNNAKVETAELLHQFRQIVTRDGYGGCGILPFGGKFAPEYMSEEYFSRYGAMVEAAKASGAVMSLYDEYGFPSGSMGQSTETEHPVS